MPIQTFRWGGGGAAGLRKKLDLPLLKKGAKVFLNCSLEYKGAFHLSELAGRPIAGPVILTMKLGSRI